MQFREMPIRMRRGKIVFPDVDELRDAPRMATQATPGWAPPLLIPCADCERDSFVADIMAWFADTDCDCARYTMVGIFGYEIHAFRIDREFKGVCIYFVDIADAVHMKLCWADRFVDSEAA